MPASTAERIPQFLDPRLEEQVDRRLERSGRDRHGGLSGGLELADARRERLRERCRDAPCPWPAAARARARTSGCRPTCARAARPGAGEGPRRAPRPGAPRARLAPAVRRRSSRGGCSQLSRPSGESRRRPVSVRMDTRIRSGADSSRRRPKASAAAVGASSHCTSSIATSKGPSDAAPARSSTVPRASACGREAWRARSWRERRRPRRAAAEAAGRGRRPSRSRTGRRAPRTAVLPRSRPVARRAPAGRAPPRAARRHARSWFCRSRPRHRARPRALSACRRRETRTPGGARRPCRGSARSWTDSKRLPAFGTVCARPAPQTLAARSCKQDAG